MMLTLILVQLRGYNQPGLDQPLHVSLCEDGVEDGVRAWDITIRDNDLAPATQASIAQILTAARTARGLVAGAPVVVQVKAAGRTITAEPIEGPPRQVDVAEMPGTIPGAISVVLNAIAQRAGASLPEPPPAP